MSTYDPNFTPTAALAVLVTSSVSTSASAAATQQGPFRGVYINTSTSFTMVGINDANVAFNDIGKGTVLWVAGKFINVIATATAIFVLK